MNKTELPFQAYVDYRLDQWADWYLRGNQYGLGYPRKSTIAQLLETKGVLIKGTTCTALFSNRRAEEVESIVKELAKQNLQRATALRMHYFKNTTIQAKAKSLGVSYTHYKLQVQKGKQWVGRELGAAS